MSNRRSLIVAALLAAFLVSVAGAQAPQVQGKKLIEFGWDIPDTSFLRAHVDEMKRTPFRGCVVNVNHVDPQLSGADADEVWARGGSGCFSWSGWGERAFREAELSRALADLQATRYGDFDQNFLRFNVTPGKVDWVDDFAAIVNNCRLIGKIAHDGNCRGILFDIEQYEDPIFDYRRQRNTSSQSWETYATQVRQRGSEVMSAFQEHFPDVTIILTFGYCLPWSEMNQGKSGLDRCEYGLLAPFLDGMVQAANGRSRLVDGHELSYGFRDADAFGKAYQTMESGVLPIVRDPKKYARVFSRGFGIWLDYDWRNKGWNAADASRNYFTPETLAASVRAALHSSDEFVWIYSEQPRWWSTQGTSVELPPEYTDALRRAAAFEPSR